MEERASQRRLALGGTVILRLRDSFAAQYTKNLNKKS